MNEVQTTQFVQDMHYVARVLQKWEAKTELYHLHQEAQQRYEIDYHKELSREGYTQ